MSAETRAVLDSLAIFDRPEGERLRDFLPRDADVEALVSDLFAPVERERSRRAATT